MAKSRRKQRFDNEATRKSLRKRKAINIAASLGAAGVPYNPAKISTPTLEAIEAKKLAAKMEKQATRRKKKSKRS